MSAAERCSICGIVGYKNDTPFTRRAATSRRAVRDADDRQRPHPRSDAALLLVHEVGERGASTTGFSGAARVRSPRRAGRPGVYGRSAAFEDVLLALRCLIATQEHAADGAELCVPARPAAHTTREERIPEVVPAPRGNRVQLLRATSAGTAHARRRAAARRLGRPARRSTDVDAHAGCVLSGLSVGRRRRDRCSRAADSSTSV